MLFFLFTNIITGAKHRKPFRGYKNKSNFIVCFESLHICKFLQKYCGLFKFVRLSGSAYSSSSTTESIWTKFRATIFQEEKTTKLKSQTATSLPGYKYQCLQFRLLNLLSYLSKNAWCTPALWRALCIYPFFLNSESEKRNYFKVFWILTFSKICDPSFHKKAPIGLKSKSVGSFFG